MTVKRDKVKLALHILERWRTLRSDQSPWLSTWQEIADYVMPRKAELFTTVENPSTSRNDGLFDTTAIFANNTLANGMLSYMTPSGSRWFSFDPVWEQKDSDPMKQWLHTCTEIAQAHLANSNFYSEMHELYFDDGGFGTSAIICLPGKSTALNFQTFDIGSYVLAEDDEGLVDTAFREIRMTSRQAALKFGEENLGPKMAADLDKYRKTGKGDSIKRSVIHAIYPREKSDIEFGKSDQPNMPYASVYVDLDDKHTIRDSGYDEKPFFATRHLKWRDSVYGYSPSYMALAEARQLNFLTKQLDALAETKAFPRFLIPETHVGSVDLAAGGMTFFDPNQQNGMPREWMTQGDYATGLDREKRKQEAIERAYHVPLFQMFAQIERQMTAREVAERSAEKLTQFTPAFTRKTTELLNPLLKRVFGILLRAGKFPPPPAEAIKQKNNSVGIEEPDISYSSRVALAIKALQNNAFYRTMDSIAPLIPMRPDLLDNFNLDRSIRDSALNDGLPADWLMLEEDRDELRGARAEAQAAAQQQQQAMEMSEAAKNAGSIKEDSVIGKAMQQQAEQQG
jgi:hypothetical protein